MKSRLSKVLGKMPKENIELAKVELGLVDDVSDALNSGNKGYQDALRINDNITKLYNKLYSVVDDIEDMETQLSNIKSAENGLGYALQVYKKTVPQIEKQAKDLGISPKEIKGYSEIQKMSDKWEKQFKELESSKKSGENILSKIK